MSWYFVLGLVGIVRVEIQGACGGIGLLEPFQLLLKFLVSGALLSIKEVS